MLARASSRAWRCLPGRQIVVAPQGGPCGHGNPVPLFPTRVGWNLFSLAPDLPGVAQFEEGRPLAARGGNMTGVCGRWRATCGPLDTQGSALAAAGRTPGGTRIPRRPGRGDGPGDTRRPHAQAHATGRSHVGETVAGWLPPTGEEPAVAVREVRCGRMDYGHGESCLIVLAKPDRADRIGTRRTREDVAS